MWLRDSEYWQPHRCVCARVCVHWGHVGLHCTCACFPQGFVTAVVGALFWTSLALSYVTWTDVRRRMSTSECDAVFRCLSKHMQVGNLHVDEAMFFCVCVLRDVLRHLIPNPDCQCPAYCSDILAPRWNLTGTTHIFAAPETPDCRSQHLATCWKATPLVALPSWMKDKLEMLPVPQQEVHRFGHCWRLCFYLVLSRWP